MSKHTPGPWILEEWDHDGISTGDFSVFPIKGSLSRMPIASVQCAFHGKRTTPNARLIAAAPDLLDAAIEFVRKVDVGEGRSTKSYAQFKAAIAKATGGES